MGGFVFSIMFAFVMWMAAIAMAIMAVIAICALMNYIFESIFLYRVSQIRNYSHGFLAWIPFLNKLRLGQIAGKKNVGILLTILDIICRNVFWSAVHGRYQSEFDHFYLMAGHIPDRFHFKHLPFSQDHEKGDAAVGGSVDFGQCVHCWNFQIDYFVPASKPEGTSGAGAGTYDFINFNLV